MKIVVAIGGSILLKEYDSKKFQEYSVILKDLSKEHELYVVVGGGTNPYCKCLWLKVGDFVESNIMISLLEKYLNSLYSILSKNY